MTDTQDMVQEIFRGRIKRKGTGMIEQWLIEAKETAKIQAELFIEHMKRIADEENLEPVWFIEEVVMNIHKMKEENE